MDESGNTFDSGFNQWIRKDPTRTVKTRWMGITEMIRDVWWKSKLFWVLLVVALYLLVGLLLVPPLVESQLHSVITSRSKLEPTVETVKFDPISFTLQLRNLRLDESNKTVFETDGLTVNFDPLSSIYRWDWSFGNVEIDSPRASVIRDESGEINWTQFYDPSGSSDESSNSTDTAYFTVDQFRLKRGEVNWSDRSQPPETNISLSKLNFKLTNLHFPPSANSPLQLQSNIGTEGVLRVHGGITGDTSTVETEFSLTDFSLPDTNEYLRSRVQGQWESGRLDFRGNLLVLTSPLTVNVTGESKVTNAHLVDLDGATVGRWEKTTVDDINVEWPQRQFRVGPVEVDSPQLVLKIEENYRTNLGQLLVPQPQEKSEPSKGPGNPWNGSVGPVRIESANLDFTDENVPGTFRANIRELAGSIGEMSTRKNDTAGISLDGTLDDQSRVSLDGTISPFSVASHSNVTMRIENIGLPTLSPYSAKFLGYNIDRGKMLLTLKYRLKEGQLSGDNHAVLKKFTLGEYVGNELIGIPIKLAVALLKDKNGVITLDVPVSGDVNDPSFEFSTVIYQSVQSALTSVVKSPFSFMAGLVNSDPEELKHVEFEPTSSQLTERAKDGLEKLVKIMEERPLIKVGVRPGWTETDRQKLAERSLDNYLVRKGESPDNLTQSISALETRFTELSGREELAEIRGKHTLEEGVITDTIDEDAYVKELYRLILEKTDVGTDQLRALAQKRASNVRKFLRNNEIQPERIFVTDPTELESDASDSMVKLPLTVDV